MAQTKPTTITETATRQTARMFSSPNNDSNISLALLIVWWTGVLLVLVLLFVAFVVVVVYWKKCHGKG
jgi:hypothetical protein